MPRRVILSIVVSALAMLAACSEQPPPFTEKRHAMEGELIRLETKDRVAIIKHGDIKDFMEAMTMGFPVPDPAQWIKLRPGMRLKATVVERQNDFYLTNIEELSPPPPPPPPEKPKSKAAKPRGGKK